jgi:Protein of unknown function (DUF4238)
MSDPMRHHYIPVFYLKRWAGADGKLCEYSRPHGETTKGLRKAPKSTAFVRDLYTIPGAPPEAAQFVEKRFMKLTDDWASRAVDVLLSRHWSETTEMDTRKRVGWARFLYSLVIRNPEYLIRIEKMAANSILEGLEESRAEYPLIRKENDPETFDEFKEKYLSNPMNMSAQSLLPTLINSTRIIRAISDMRWSTCQFTDTDHSLLTSDRPVIMTNGLTAPGAHIAIPLSPSRLFFAVLQDDEKAYNEIRKRPLNILVKSVNERMALQARRYVYGRDDSQLRFVAKRLGKMVAATPLG